MLKAVLASVAAIFALLFHSPDSLVAKAQDGNATYAEMSIGNDQATVTVVEYASFTCPHCGSFHEEVFGRLQEEYIDTGKINFELREVYFDLPGLWAGILARCGGSEKYFGIVDLLFERQPQWSRRESALEIVEELTRIGLVAGIEKNDIDACFQDGESAEILYNAYKQFAEDDGIKSTPSFVIDGELYGYMQFDEFSGILDGLLQN